MVDNTKNQQLQAEAQAVLADPRMKSQREWAERIKANQPNIVVRVSPTSEDIRKFIKHPKAGAFREGNTTEWPLDRFTQRRLADGDIKLEGDVKK